MAQFEDSAEYEVWTEYAGTWEMYAASNDLLTAIGYGQRIELTPGESVHLVRVIRQGLGEIPGAQ